MELSAFAAESDASDPAAKKISGRGFYFKLHSQYVNHAVI
jgi:hypothetical protein